jgi:hypothetical protein
VTCDSKAMMDRVLKENNHKVKSRIVDVSKALEEETEVPIKEIEKGLRKLYVGGVDRSTTEGSIE